LTGRLQKLELPFLQEFELLFDGAWTDLFWDFTNDGFDEIYQDFFGVLLLS
jgi:hypothetical protein